MPKPRPKTPTASATAPASTGTGGSKVPESSSRGASPSLPEHQPTQTAQSTSAENQLSGDSWAVIDSTEKPQASKGESPSKPRDSAASQSAPQSTSVPDQKDEQPSSAAAPPGTTPAPAVVVVEPSTPAQTRESGADQAPVATPQASVATPVSSVSASEGTAGETPVLAVPVTCPAGATPVVATPVTNRRPAVGEESSSPAPSQDAQPAKSITSPAVSTQPAPNSMPHSATPLASTTDPASAAASIEAGEEPPELVAAPTSLRFPFAIRHIEFCQKSLSLTVSNEMSSVLVCRFGSASSEPATQVSGNFTLAVA